MFSRNLLRRCYTSRVQLLDGRYSIIRVLAKSGFRQTYLAIDTRCPGHPLCIIKRLQPINSNPESLPEIHRFFNNEAETLRILGQNDQIPQLLAFFEEKKSFFLVQEYIQGHPLSQEIVPRQPFSSRQIVQLLRDILEILTIVHHQQVIHRDIQPNHLIRRDVDGKLVLTDFGAIKEFQVTAGITQLQSNLSIVVGTQAYMPIEQLAGYPQFNSDLYAVGVIAIQAASGLTIDELQPLLNPQVPDTSPEPWRDRMEVCPELATLLKRLVHPDYKQRYQSALDVLADLELTFR